MGGSLSPTLSKLKPTGRLNSPTMKLAQPQRADQAGWNGCMGEKGWQVDLVARDDVAEIAGREGVQLP